MCFSDMSRKKKNWNKPSFQMIVYLKKKLILSV